MAHPCPLSGWGNRKDQLYLQSKNSFFLYCKNFITVCEEDEPVETYNIVVEILLNHAKLNK